MDSKFCPEFCSIHQASMISPSDITSGSNQQLAEHTDWGAKLGFTIVNHCHLLLIPEREKEKDQKANINIFMEYYRETKLGNQEEEEKERERENWEKIEKMDAPVCLTK